MRAEPESDNQNVAVADRRSRQRFPLQWPARLRSVDGGPTAGIALEGETLDISAAGFYLRTDAGSLQEGGLVEVDFRIPGGSESRRVDLHGLGRIVRVDRQQGGQTGIAVAFDRIEFWPDDLDSFT